MKTIIPDTVIAEMQHKAYEFKNNIPNLNAHVASSQNSLRKSEVALNLGRRQLWETAYFLNEHNPDGTHGTWFAELGVDPNEFSIEDEQC